MARDLPAALALFFWMALAALAGEGTADAPFDTVRHSVDLNGDVVFVERVSIREFKDYLVEEGFLDGVKYRLFVPARPNGDIILGGTDHRGIDPGLVPGSFSEEIEAPAADLAADKDSERGEGMLHFLRTGVTYVYSSGQGHAVNTVDENIQAMLYARQKYQLAGKTYAVGGSQGGLISALTVLWYPDLIHGARISGTVVETVQPDQYHLGRSLFEEANQGSRLGPQKLYPVISPHAFAPEGEWVERWNEMLPMSYAHSLQRPVIMFAGNEDQFVPPYYDRFFEALTHAGKRDLLQYVETPRAGHGESHKGTYISAVENVMARAKAQGDVPVTRPNRRVEGPLTPLPFACEPLPEDHSAGPEPDLLRVKSQLGQGSWLGEFNALKIADLDGDGRAEIVFGNLEGFVTALTLTDDKKLNKVWQSPDLGQSIAGLAIADIDGKRGMEVIAGNEQGMLVILDGAGKRIVWRSEPLGEACFNIQVGEPAADGHRDLFVATRDGYLYHIDGSTREVIWKSPRIDGIQHALALTQLDADPQPEILVGTMRGEIFAFDSKTHTQDWRPSEVPRLSVQIWNMLVLDVDADPQPEIIVSGGTDYPRPVNSRQEHGSYGGVYVIDSNTKQVEAKFDECDSIYAFAAHDLNGDGRADLLMAGQTGQVWRLLAGSSKLETPAQATGPRILGLASGRLRSNGPEELVATTFHGDVRVHELNRGLALVAEVKGLGGAYGLAVQPANGHSNADLFLSAASGAIYKISGPSLASTVWQPAPANWNNSRRHKWYHALTLADNSLFAATGLGWFRGGGGVYQFDRESGSLLAGGATSELPRATASPTLRGPRADFSTWGLAVDDLDGDGSLEIVTGDDDGYLEVRRAQTMQILNRSWDFGHDVYGLRILDVDGDKSKDILAGMCGGFVHLIDRATFKEKWISDDLGWNTWGLDAADLDGDGMPEVAVGTQDSGLFVLDGSTGKIKWRRDDLGRHLYGVCIADIDHDSAPEILVGSGAGYLYVLNGKTSQTRWRSPGLGNFLGAYNSIRVADIDGDRMDDIICGGSGYLTVLSRNR